MRRFGMLATALLMVLGLASWGCGGRSHLSDRAGRSWRALQSAQFESRPAQRLGQLGASDARIAMENHTKVSTGRKSSRSGKRRIRLSGRSGGGQLTPATGDLGGDESSQ